jgi:hypothetical protein
MDLEIWVLLFIHIFTDRILLLSGVIMLLSRAFRCYYGYVLNSFQSISTTKCEVQGPVVQSWISANLGLKFNLLFYLCFSARPYNKIKLLLIQTRILKKYIQVCEQAVGKFAFNFTLT